MLAKLFQITLLIGPCPLEAGHQIAQQVQVLIEPLVDVVDGGRHLHDSLRPPIGRLQGDDDVVRGAQGREADQRESRWAVEHDEIVPCAEFGDRIDEREMQVGLFPRLLIRKIEPGQCRPGRNEIDM